MIEWPARIRQLRRIDVPCGSVDILPTLMELAGAKVEREIPLDAVSLAPLLEGKGYRRGSPLGFCDYPIGGKPVRSSDLLEQLSQEQAAGSVKPNREAGHFTPPIRR